MNTSKNFAQKDTRRFSDRVHHAAEHGNFNAAPILRLMEDIQALNRGISQTLLMERNNDLQQYIYDDREDGEHVEPPLSNYAMGALLEMARVSSTMIVDRIDELSDWADQYGVITPPPEPKASGKGGK